MKNLFAVVLILFSTAGFAQVEEAKPYAETITIEDLKDYLGILASDVMEGRETGERGQQMAAAFIKSHFNDWNLEPPVKMGEVDSYYQNVPLYISKLENAVVKVGNNIFENYGDIMYYGRFDMEREEELELIYAGDASEEALKAVNVEGKAVIITGDDRNFRNRVEAVSDAGASLVFISRSPDVETYNTMVGRFKYWLQEGRLSLEKPSSDPKEKGIFFISPEFAPKVFGMSSDKFAQTHSNMEEGDYSGLKKMKPVKISYMIDHATTEIKSENVLGYLEGTDLKDEVIVLTAHYDHVGRNEEEIFNGADDDGSGTSAVMEIAQAFATAAEKGDRPRRSLLFMLVTGEEKGLLGSAYYADNPIFPLENTVANLNIDMIGRVDPKYKEEGNQDYVYLVGSDRLSTELHEISENINASTTNLTLDYTYNDENHPDRIYYRSDHWNFAKNNVPVIFYFNGVHEDYHKPTDTVEKIEWDILHKRTRLVFFTAWELANRDTRPVVDKAKSEESGR